MKMYIDIDESVYMGITHRQKICITDMCKACIAIMKGTIIAIEPKESKAKNKDCSTCIYCRDGFCGDEACAGCFEDPEHANYEPRERELIDKYNLLAAIKTFDNFGFVEPNCFVRNPTGNVVTYIRYNDVIKCIKCQKGSDENDS